MRLSENPCKDNSRAQVVGTLEELAQLKKGQKKLSVWCLLVGTGLIPHQRHRSMRHVVQFTVLRVKHRIDPCAWPCEARKGALMHALIYLNGLLGYTIGDIHTDYIMQHNN
jgi:hypothetical protein